MLPILKVYLSGKQFERHGSLVSLRPIENRQGPSCAGSALSHPNIIDSKAPLERRRHIVGSLAALSLVKTHSRHSGAEYYNQMRERDNE